MQTPTGTRSKLKGFIAGNKNHSNAGEKLETTELEKCTRENEQNKTLQNSGGNMKTRELTYYGDDGENDGEDLTRNERTTGD